MAYFAELDEKNVVLQVVAINNAVIQDNSGNDIEQKGIDYCKQLFGEETVWKQTSYNTRGGQHLLGKNPLRKNYAGIGFVYDAERDAFIPPKPDGVGWILNEETCGWFNPELEAEIENVQIGITRV